MQCFAFSSLRHSTVQEENCSLQSNNGGVAPLETLTYSPIRAIITAQNSHFERFLEGTQWADELKRSSI